MDELLISVLLMNDPAKKFKPSLCFSGFQTIDIFADFPKPGGYGNGLRALADAVAASDAAVGLTQFGHFAVITDQKGAPCALIVRVAGVTADVVIFEALVVVSKNRGNVDAVRARQTVAAICAGNFVVGENFLGDDFEKFALTVVDRLER